MLEIKYIRKNLSVIEQSLNVRGVIVDLQTLLSFDEKRRTLLRELETLRHRRNTVSDEIAAMKKVGENADVKVADIQLADGSSGLDAVNELLRSFEVPVIFITAYPERFLTGERPEPAFLIAKPFQPATVSAVISQALFFERNARRRERRAS